MSGAGRARPLLSRRKDGNRAFVPTEDAAGILAEDGRSTASGESFFACGQAGSLSQYRFRSRLALKASRPHLTVGHAGNVWRLLANKSTERNAR